MSKALAATKIAMLPPEAILVIRLIIIMSETAESHLIGAVHAQSRNSEPLRAG